MRFLIAGAGAIGGYIGARMAHAGFDVTLFARGPHLRAMQDRGVQIRSSEGDFVARPTIAASLEEVGLVDVVFLGVKAHALPQLAPQLKPVLGPDTTVVSTQNGIPWWYFQGFGGEWEGLRLERVDPGGVFSAAIEARRVLGSII
ncbi:MAG: 2-dehydropantoate 2-reductase N-terminal domain-containing protein, partial [Candidatus Sulfotelmatobacter sp.]